MHDAWLSSQFAGSAGPDDHALFQHEMAICQLQQGTQVFIDHDQGQALKLQFPQCAPDFCTNERSQTLGRLIQYNKTRICHQGATNSQHLLLTAGQSASELAEHARVRPDFAAWQRGYGPLQHSPQTCAAVYRLAHQLVQAGQQADLATVYRHFYALDRLTAAGLWLVVHMTYARRVRLDGVALTAEDFKVTPEGHTGGALNMVPAYAGYLALMG